ncbi:protein DpdH [Kitasatospora aureofaciens]|uniref:protein DpdH n=1 Tax=Kitasatospora aureofaciens TaxID=1894 RepID=UPI0036F4B06A
MADFRGYLCWDPATAATTINTEAVSPPRAVFLATHVPLRIQRARPEGRTLVKEGRPVDEQVVLKDFLTRKSDTGALLMPIVGDSGSGKSHLVRWVKEHIPSTDKRQVIYLEKAKTSLRGVIESLLAEIETGDLAQLKADLDKFTADVDQAALARRLLNALEEVLAATTSKDVSGPARALTGPRGLAVILQDPHVREYMLASDRYIPQLADQLLNDRTDGSAERPQGFTADDLPLDIADVKLAAKVTQDLLGQLMTRDDLQASAVDLLNQHLEPAVKNAANLGTGRLQDAMVEVRREYARQGKEIILLVEDFALIQGVQRDLLDAVVEAANRDGRTILAPIRTLMAVTTGYFRELPETALTRVRATTGYVYDLDVPYDKDDNGAAQITSFVGHYLNAARIGRDDLERMDDSATPNFCESCPFQARCHDTFGATAEGHGLYPFNEPALIRAVHSTAPKNEPWAFVPRTVLGSVVRPVLVEHATSLREGEFPSPRFREQFPTASIDHALSGAVRESVDDSDHVDAERRKLTLEFWGDAPQHAAALDPKLLQAFSMAPLSATGRVGLADVANQGPQRSSRPVPAPAPSAPDSALPKSLLARLQSAEDWISRDRTLEQATARDIRGVVAEAVIQRYRWTTPLMQAQSSKLLTNAWPRDSRTVSIEDAGGEGRAEAARPEIRFDRKAANSEFFKSILCAKHGHGRARAEDIRRLSRYADLYSDALTSAVQRHLEISDDELVLGMRASLLGAALAGRAWPGLDDAALLSVVLDEGRTWNRADVGLRTRQWNETLARHLKARPALVERIRTSMGIAQGSTGAVKMIDAARAVPLLRQAASEWNWDIEGLVVPTWVRPAVIGFASWMTSVDDQAALLRERLHEVRSRQPRGTASSHTLSAIRGALTAAREVGLPLATSDAERIESLILRVQDADWKAISELEDDLEKASGPNRSEGAQRTALVVAAVRDRGDAFEDIRQLLVAADAWLDEALNSAESRSGEAGDSAALGVQELLNEWRELAAARGDEQ